MVRPQASLAALQVGLLTILRFRLALGTNTDLEGQVARLKVSKQVLALVGRQLAPLVKDVALLRGNQPFPKDLFQPRRRTRAIGRDRAHCWSLGFALLSQSKHQAVPSSSPSKFYRLYMVCISYTDRGGGPFAESTNKQANVIKSSCEI